MLLTNGFVYVAKFTTLTSLALLSSCNLSFPIVGLKISSPVFHYNLLSQFSYGALENERRHALIPHKTTL